jgi:Bacterial Ig-like domain
MNKLFTVTLHAVDAKVPPQLVSAVGGAGARGQTQRIAVPTSARIELIEDAQKAAPKRVQIKRVGKDLHVVFDEGDIRQPDVILENYYREDGAQRLVGRTESGGNLYEYFPENTQSAEYVGVIGQDFPSHQILSTDHVAAAAWGGAGGISGTTLAAAGAGLLALGAAGGGGGSSPLAPEQPASRPLAGVAPTSDTGILGDNVTRDATPSITGTGTPGATIEVTIGGQTLRTTVAADGTWSVTPTVALADGTYTAEVRQIDAQGRTSEPAQVVVTIDTGMPSVAAVLATSSDSGIASDAVTNDATPTLSGIGKPGDTVTVVIDGQTLTTTVAADGTWSVTPATPLADGSYTAQVTVSDTAGNSTTASVPLTVDTTIGAAAVLASGSDTGTASDAITSDSTPTIEGAGTPGDSITVVIAGQTLTTTVAADGTCRQRPPRWPMGPTAPWSPAPTWLATAPPPMCS